jgi:2,4-dienoyl-CoA reductase-like NADH-dependent reductase (Old Yellow Enzyme family)
VAAQRAARAGFDGVELHGAHGYLLHQFLSTATNQRTDAWGGSFDNRAKLLRTILKEIRASVSTSFIVGVRISPEDKYTFKGIDFDESLQLAGLLAEDGADYIHVSPWEASKFPDKYPDSGKPLVTWFREVLPIHTALITAGGIWTVDDAARILAYGADLIALGRVAIGVPSWPSDARKPDFVPLMPPYTPLYLKRADLGDAFIEYMRRWTGFVGEK